MTERESDQRTDVCRPDRADGVLTNYLKTLVSPESIRDQDLPEKDDTYILEIPDQVRNDLLGVLR